MPVAVCVVAHLLSLHVALAHVPQHQEGMRLVRPALDYLRRAGHELYVPRNNVSSARAYSATRSAGTRAAGIYGSRKLELGTRLRDAPNEGPLAAYARLVLDGKIHEDRHQVTALCILQEVCVFCSWCSVT